MTHIKVPKDRVGAPSSVEGRVKQIIEEKSTAKLDIDSEKGRNSEVSLEMTRLAQ
ncbi:MAG: hypothetical protein R2741_09875 [Methanolobus sp.]